MDYFHQPVLLNEVIKFLDPKPNQNLVDGTLGGGGHARSLLEKISPNGVLLGLDRDPRAIKAAGKKLSDFKKRIILIQGSYLNIKKIINDQGINLQFSGILLDLGISSAQVSAEDERGFSFQSEKPLDMRFGPDTDLTASQILNDWPEEKLAGIFKEYGQEPRARAIARQIVHFRKIKPVELTSQLVEIIQQVYRGQLNRSGKKAIHPATKTFQALRIAVNGELINLTNSLPELLDVLAVGGRLAIISYHSLEDKIVKDFFRSEAKDCICPKDFPVCRCDHRAVVKLITKKPLVPSAEEIEKNPRSRSAKLRVVQKINH